jgi:ribokinase
MRIAVFGSLIIDHSLSVPRIPAPGETIIALDSLESFGGKGANQAVAAARAGGDVLLAGCVGDDNAGRRFREQLTAEGICIDALRTSMTQPTGCAFIAVDAQGENSIVVNPRANLDQPVPPLPPVDFLLLQLECPLSISRALAKSAKAQGATIILNPSPWNEAVLAEDFPIDILIVNEHEHRASTSLASPLRIVTRGADSTLAIGDGASIEVRPPRVSPVDTVGAGDTFAGSFAVAQAQGLPLAEAIAFANAAAALSTLKPGAQTAMPNAKRIAQMLSGQCVS